MSKPFDEQDTQAILKRIAQRERRVGMPTIERVKDTDFFNSHNNTFDGYYIWVKYPDGIFELFFVVDVRGSTAGDDWFVENIT